VLVPVLLALTLLATACSGSGTGDVSGDDIPPAEGDGTPATGSSSVALELRAPRLSLPLGEPLPVTIAVRNDGARSVSVPVDLDLRPPAGEPVRFYSTSIFAPAGSEATEAVKVTPAQWFPDRGSFQIAATTEEGPAADRLAFDVGEPTVVVPVFEDVTTEAGLTTTVPQAECGQFANGAAWADVDGDGNLDLLLTRLGDPVQLFVADGQGRFSDEAAARGLPIGDANGAGFADYDNDGDTDLFLARDGSDKLFANDGDGRFTDVSDQSGIGDDDRRGIGVSWGDFDGDGDLDLFVTNYMTCLGEWRTEEDIISQVAYFPDTLYRNEGDGTFSDATHVLENDPDEHDDGTTMGAGFAAAWLDYNGDNRPDLYLANDFVGPSPDHNRLWRNDGPVDGGWRFTDVSVDTGTALFMNAMGIGIGDVDRDGDLDMALSNITDNKLLRNDGGDGFVEELDAGVGRPLQRAGLESITWGGGFHDLNLDGWEDLYLAAGNFLEGVGAAVGVQPNELFVSDGTGQRFLDVSAATGADDPGDSKGVAFADYDRDGDVDMFVVNQGGRPRLYRNATPTGGYHWLEVDTVGTISNRDGCGARLVLTMAGGSMTRQVSCGSTSVASGSQHTVHFGLGEAAAVDRLDIVWPSGTRQQLDDPEIDRILTVEEPSA